MKLIVTMAVLSGVFLSILRAVIISVFYIPKSPVYKSCVEGITENLTARSIQP
jgi:hypothetical protein